jgi:hypothetical protein
MRAFLTAKACTVADDGLLPYARPHETSRKAGLINAIILLRDEGTISPENFGYSGIPHPTRLENTMWLEGLKPIIIHPSKL